MIKNSMTFFKHSYGIITGIDLEMLIKLLVNEKRNERMILVNIKVCLSRAQRTFRG